MRTPALALFLVFVTGILPAHATLDSFDFSGQVSEDRYKQLIAELRCLVCQNESLIGSQAELAQDLRKEVYDLMAQGKSDSEVVDFLVARYGDFVLYNPPLRPSTYPLWIGPFLLLLIALWILFRSISRRNRAPAHNLSETERKQVAALLDETPGDKESH